MTLKQAFTTASIIKHQDLIPLMVEVDEMKKVSELCTSIKDP